MREVFQKTYTLGIMHHAVSKSSPSFRPNGHKRSQTVTKFLTAIFYGKPNGHNGHKFFIIKVGGLYPFNKKFVTVVTVVTVGFSIENGG